MDKIIDYTGMSPEAQAFIRISPKVKNMKLCRVGADIAVFGGCKDVLVKKFKMRANGKLLVSKLFYPKGNCTHKCFVYFHGGGFLFGGIKNSEGALRDYCDMTGNMVLSVKYSLAPEYQYPNAVNECFEIARKLIDEADRLGIDKKIFIGGDSAGGNLALVTALRLREIGYMTAGQILFYPFCQLMYEGIENQFPSLKYLAEGYFLDRYDLDRMTRLYLGDKTEDVNFPLISPLNANFEGLSPTLIFEAGFDPLKDTYIRLSERMKEANVRVKHVAYPETIHGFFTLFEEHAKKSIREINSFFAT